MVICTICHHDFYSPEQFRQWDCPHKNKDGKCPSTVLDRFRENYNTRQSTYAIIGVPESGKSYFIYSLLHTLKNPPPALEEYMTRINMQVRTSGEQALEQIKRFEEQMMYSGNQLEGTDKQAPQNNVPIDVVVTVGRGQERTTICLTFFDMSGEHFKDMKYMLEQTRIHKARGVILLMSPYDDVKLHNCLPEDYHSTKRIENTPLTDYLFQAIQENISRRRTRKVNTPLAICISMFDLLKDMVPDEITSPYLEVHDMINEHDEFDYTKIKANSQLVRSFLQVNSRVPLKGIEDNFSKVNYFALSSVGHNEMEKIPTQGLKPHGILAPLFWLLAETEIIPFLKEHY